MTAAESLIQGLDVKTEDSYPAESAPAFTDSGQEGELQPGGPECAGPREHLWRVTQSRSSREAEISEVVTQRWESSITHNHQRLLVQGHAQGLHLM